MNQRTMLSSLGLLTCVMLACDPSAGGTESELGVELEDELDDPEVDDEMGDAVNDVGLAGEPRSFGLSPIKRTYEFSGQFDDSPALYNTRPVGVHINGRMALAASHRATPTAELDAHVTMVDPAGNVVWARRYGNQGVEERALGTMFTPSGDLMVVGSGDGRPLRFKLDAAGDLLWAYEEPILGNGKATTIVAQGTDYLASGSVDAGGSVLPFATKFADDGTLLWANVFQPLGGGAFECEVSDVLDGGQEVYLVGTRKNLVNSDQSMFILTVAAATGSALEMREYPHVDPVVEQATQAPTLVKLSDGTFAVGYSVYVQGDGYRAAIARLDANLDPIGETHYYSESGTPGVRESLGLSLHAAASGGLHLRTAYGEYGGLLHLDDSGAILDSRIYGGVGETFEHVGAATPAAGGYAFVAHDQGAVHLTVADAAGSGPCAAEHAVHAEASEISMGLVPHTTGTPPAYSLTYPLTIGVDSVSTTRSCQ